MRHRIPINFLTAIILMAGTSFGEDEYVKGVRAGIYQASATLLKEQNADLSDDVKKLKEVIRQAGTSSAQQQAEIRRLDLLILQNSHAQHIDSKQREIDRLIALTKKIQKQLVDANTKIGKKEKALVAKQQTADGLNAALVKEREKSAGLNMQLTNLAQCNTVVGSLFGIPLIWCTPSSGQSGLNPVQVINERDSGVIHGGYVLIRVASVRGSIVINGHTIPRTGDELQLVHVPFEGKETTLWVGEAYAASQKTLSQGQILYITQ